MFAEVALSRYLNLADEVLKLSICSSSLHCLELHNNYKTLGYKGLKVVPIT
jgi:hypothetical protein